jgi:O-antigen ligase
MPLKAIFSYIFSFSSIFVLFLFSYQYKHTIDFFKTYDPTLYLGLIVLIYVMYFVIRNYANIRFHKCIAVFGLFALWVVGSYFWSAGSAYVFAKTVRFLVYSVPAFLTAALIIASSPKRLDGFIDAFLLFWGIILSNTLVAYFKNPENLVTLFGTNYLVTGQTIGLGAVILGAKLFHQDVPSIFCKKTLLLVSGIFITVFLELHLGGRGPLLSTLIVLGGLYALKGGSQKFLIVSLAGLSGVVGFLLVKNLGHTHLPASLSRMFSADGIQSVALRLEYYQSALQCLQEHLVKGAGIGSWPDYYGLEKLYELEWHPHNIFLEIAAETGLVGLSLFICLIVLLLKKVRKQIHNNDLLLTILLCGIAFCFLNAIRSGDLNDNIILFTFMGLIAGFKQKRSFQEAPL